MPRSTVQYAFERALLAWAQHFRSGDGFLAVFDPAGNIAQVYEAEPAPSGRGLIPHELMERVTQAHASWMFFDPFDWPEYAWLAWKAVPAATLKQLLDEHWANALSASANDPKELPESWGVMF